MRGASVALREAAVPAAVACAASLALSVDVGYWWNEVCGYVALLCRRDAGAPASALLAKVVRRARVHLVHMDRNFHMNNAAYARESNFARRDFWRRLAGVLGVMRAQGLGFVVAAQAVRHRRELRLWDAYDLESRLLCWSDEDRSFFMEFRFVKGGFVHAVHHVKYTVVGKRRGDGPPLTPSELLDAAGISLPSPRMPEDVKAWRAQMSASSRILRAEAGLGPAVP